MNKIKKILSFCCSLLVGWISLQAQQPVDFVNPFIGTTNYGTTNPGAVRPNGLMSVAPFNVMGSRLNRFDKDKQWWSTPYDYTNKYLTGFSHVNLSGVGCSDLGSLLLMPTTGKVNPDYTKYGSTYSGEKACPGYYSVYLSKYNVLAEVTATLRTGRARFTFPGGQSNILLNLGEGLTNETGATVRFTADNEVEGSKLMGGFCYAPDAVFPVYFVMKAHKTPSSSGYWKKIRPINVEAQWDSAAGKYKIYSTYRKNISGDDVGVWMSFQTSGDEVVEVSMGVSFVSVENARLNLAIEQNNKEFDQIRDESRQEWNELLSRIQVEGGTSDQKTIFYTALYHTLIHPNILQDVNGEYPEMESHEVKTTNRNRYTVFSLWDTYRNLHQLMTLVYPERQMDMLHSMLGMYLEHGWLPKWELYGQETLTMEGDPAIPIMVDSWMKGLRNFDINLAYEAMVKSATTSGSQNLLRQDNDYYTKIGYVPLQEQYDNSVSHALEYFIADYALSTLAEALGKKEDATLFRSRSMGYRHYYCPEFGTFRPRLEDGSFYSPFHPMQGENFEPSPGFHEGNAWNYTFYVPHDIKGLALLMGGQQPFVDKLQSVFDLNRYDPANEPDIAYPYLFSYFPDQAWRTQKEVRRLLNKYYKNQPNGIPGNDDTGTLSAWAVFSMIGFYPDVPGVPEYTLTTPVFNRSTIQLNKEVYGLDCLVIETSAPPEHHPYSKAVKVGSKWIKEFRISHQDLIHAGKLKFQTSKQP